MRLVSKTYYTSNESVRRVHQMVREHIMSSPARQRPSFLYSSWDRGWPICPPRLITTATCMYGWHSGTPRRSPTAVCTTLSSMCRPGDVIGGAFSQAPDSFVEATKSLAWSLGLLVASRRPSRVAWTLGWSQHLWWMFPGETGGWWLWPTFHSSRASSAAQPYVFSCKAKSNITLGINLAPFDQ